MTLDNISDTNCPPLLWPPSYLLPVWKGIVNWLTNWFHKDLDGSWMVSWGVCFRSNRVIERSKILKLRLKDRNFKLMSLVYSSHAS